MTTNSIDRYRKLFSETAAPFFRQKFAAAYEADPGAAVFDSTRLYGLLETPRDSGMGRFALPLFKQAKLLGQAPPFLAQLTASGVNDALRSNGVADLICSALGGYVNVSVGAERLAGDLFSVMFDHPEQFGSSTVGLHKTIVIEYSSPNIAKPFGVGHLRSTAIGNSLCRIYRKLGYTVAGINFPGDWGTQFGKMIVAWRRWGGDHLLQSDSVKNLLDLYVRFHTEAEEHPELEDEARQAFQSLESGDPEAVALWTTFKTISNSEFERVYNLLGITFEAVIPESFFNDKMEAAIARLSAAGLTKESQGALIVETDDPNLPPALLRKRDGATLYTTRDMAGLLYRWETWKFHESLYVVGTAQSDHFKVCFKVIDMLEQAEQTPPAERMSGRIRHVDFGWVKFGDKTMSTRRGNIVLLEDVINTAIEKIREQMRIKNPNLEQLDLIAQQIGIGAVIFTQLSVRRQTDVHFIWEQVLTFDGETGPYLQYTHARLASLLRAYGKPAVLQNRYDRLDSPEDLRILELLADFPFVIEEAANQYDPFPIASYLFRLTGAFNRLYQRKDEQGRIVKLLNEQDATGTAQRICLIHAVRAVVAEGLFLLGLKAPEQM